jgi:hypothetical protein
LNHATSGFGTPVTEQSSKNSFPFSTTVGSCVALAFIMLVHGTNSGFLIAATLSVNVTQFWFLVTAFVPEHL